MQTISENGIKNNINNFQMKFLSSNLHRLFDCRLWFLLQGLFSPSSSIRDPPALLHLFILQVSSSPSSSLRDSPSLSHLFVLTFKPWKRKSVDNIGCLKQKSIQMVEVILFNTSFSDVRQALF